MVVPAGTPNPGSSGITSLKEVSIPPTDVANPSPAMVSITGPEQFAPAKYVSAIPGLRCSSPVGSQLLDHERLRRGKRRYCNTQI